MIPLRRQMLLKLFRFSDVFILSFSYFLTALIYSDITEGTPLSEFVDKRFPFRDILFFCCLLLSWNIISSLSKIYYSWRIYSLKTGSSDLLIANFFLSLALLLLGRLFLIEIVGFWFSLLFCFSSTILMIANRIAIRCCLTLIRRRGRNLRHVLIVGTYEGAIELARVIETNGGLGYRFFGFVNMGKEKLDQSEIPSDAVLTNIEGFPNFLKDQLNTVDEVWIAVPMAAYSEEIAQVERFCKELGLIVRFFPGKINLGKMSSDTEIVEGLFALTRYPSPQLGVSLLLKRLLDLSISFVSFLLLSPLLIFVVFLIKKTSPGPAFFIQERVGRYRKRFFMYKFRTMRETAEAELFALEDLNEFSGPAFKIKNDPRLTKVGRFLRKTSIDELPQLLNVMKGEMSLVGPRPLPVRDYEKFYEDRHYRRFSVFPGLTCLWQSNGRNFVPFDKWMEMDLQYVNDWSFWLDIDILLRTVPSVIRGTGAS